MLRATYLVIQHCTHQPHHLGPTCIVPGGGATAGAEAKLCSREIIQAAAKETCNICYSVEHVSKDPWTVDILHSTLFYI